MRCIMCCVLPESAEKGVPSAFVCGPAWAKQEACDAPLEGRLLVVQVVCQQERDEHVDDCGEHEPDVCRGLGEREKA